MIIMQTQIKFCVHFIKRFSDDSNLPLIVRFGPSPDIEKLFLWFPEWDDELLSTPKMRTFLT